MERCNGCFPIYQQNQMAHMGREGCLYIEETTDEICLPVDLGSVFDRIAEQDKEKIITKPVEQKVYADDDNECIICYENISKTNNCVTPCGHAFCFTCLINSMTLRNTCPYCRTELFTVPASDKNEEDEDDDEDEDEDDDEDDDEDGENGSNSESDGNYEDNNIIPVETIVARLEEKGFTMLDTVSMMTNNYSKIDPKYTNEYIANMNKTFDDLMADIDNEYDEQRKFAAEDIRTRENSRV